MPMVTIKGHSGWFVVEEKFDGSPPKVQMNPDCHTLFPGLAAWKRKTFSVVVNFSIIRISEISRESYVCEELGQKAQHSLITPKNFCRFPKNVRIFVDFETDSSFSFQCRSWMRTRRRACKEKIPKNDGDFLPGVRFRHIQQRFRCYGGNISKSLWKNFP